NALEYSTTPYPSDFTIKGVKFRNAICYEATCSEIYEDNPEYVVATSNNGWFVPSIEPTLQNLLIKYYARKYNSTVLHVTNMSGSKVIF
ncbi:MAG: apolipoprotein N-acyltransferase, partial [Campylobacterota bacterium]|nr:apolipoprotein N-acyltransferase [Campylobacterota bacterium]